MLSLSLRLWAHLSGGPHARGSRPLACLMGRSVGADWGVPESAPALHRRNRRTHDDGAKAEVGSYHLE